ncbi:CTD small phosphatase-like protein 2-A isoform X1 [Phoenix dactylifera]|uniref:CTD small phosphatase-like protein 2-A isoform X1 n=2 Tax=Phoenix dactylifera TaxID=42345 RepID=A0A8B7BSN2_PHODC|nr:CTD small phosphatase-like protein 2-A isoform X1 [Phoenix dactylifera]XP_008784415.2 CTD small phosphatase-like protein 2-A isoform X1 [Phoenix dactylifera]XP_008784416.2 CTD small phosphatase-like protein 2-A isoform X1 [Phoenix dactylifera]XP_008784417.2 CTD small phosphatase-like protein 2-A isoform X1 [Phoenix dactylifera]XP_017697358.2 CTD small phosphatase-like protein 2-A isoform X1 [Phoenix dactylifera]XP_038984947.1 CTD small phosphatase-like protein 2-A isoform X1 [Phoenix dactyl
MPALKMKNKSRTDCVGGRNLHTCHKSVKISKSLQSQVKTLEQAAFLDIPTEIPHDDSLGIETLSEKIQRTEASDDFAHASAQLINSVSASADSASTGTKASQFSTSRPISEALFSPVIEYNESQFKPVNHGNAVRDDEHDEVPSLIANDIDNGNCNESEVQTANFWDLYTSEKVAASPFDVDIGFSDGVTTACPDYVYMQPDLFFDKQDSYVILPFFEKTGGTITSHDQDPIEEPAVRSDGSCLYLAIHQLNSSDQETESSYNLEEAECFDPQLFFKSLPDLPDLSEAVSPISPAFLPKEIGRKKSVTLVLDLDETLVHSTLEHCDDADFTFPVFFNMKQHSVYVRKRPYLETFLEKVSQMFEIVIFTASQSIYAEQLLNILDPDRKLISRRIYRESCIFSDGSYTKDLTILGVDLAKVAIIDNSPQVFQLQVNNGIPIKSWFDDPSDHALISLLPFLETLVDAEDVRPIIAERFDNKE